MKLAVNTIIFGLNQAIAEGLVLAEAAGVDRARAYEVISSSAVAAPFVQYKRAAFVEPDATPVAFALELAAKDLGLIRELADDVGLRLPQAEVDLELIRSTIAAGRAGRDFSMVAEHLRSSRAKEGAASR
jgi:3-hydroxyisobutyrate dehydrogenase/2-hydroxy-3-oxopropionate reductase